jgi:ABC-2 type transport system permease protein
MLRLALRTVFAYRTSVVVSVVMLILEVFLLRKIWTSVYGGQTSVDGLSLRALLVYLTLANLQAFVTATTVSHLIHMRIRTGVVFFDFVRPVSYVRQMIQLQMGTTLGRLAILLPAIPLAFAVGSISAPSGISAAVTYVFSLLIGYLIGVLMAVLLGMCAFWTLEITGIALFYRLVSQFFAGTMVPLTFFPGPLRTVADLLPFRFMGYVPAAIYVGAITGAEAVSALIAQVLWLVALFGLVWLVWYRAHRRLVVHGG